MVMVMVEVILIQQYGLFSAEEERKLNPSVEITIGVFYDLQPFHRNLISSPLSYVAVFYRLLLVMKMCFVKC